MSMCRVISCVVEGVCHDQCILSAKLYWPLPCFILYPHGQTCLLLQVSLVSYVWIPGSCNEKGIFFGASSRKFCCIKLMCLISDLATNFNCVLCFLSTVGRKNIFPSICVSSYFSPLSKRQNRSRRINSSFYLFLFIYFFGESSRILLTGTLNYR